MNPGFRVSSFIVSYTGITNKMLAGAPPCEEVMEAFARFMGDCPLVAHNAAFDRRFLEAELARIGTGMDNELACSMLAARRVYPDAPDHKLGTLVRYCGIETDGIFHRALADAEMTGRLWLAMAEELRARCTIDEVPFALMANITRVRKADVGAFLHKAARADGVEKGRRQK
jgi:DNA polymerase-3 subunit epsilon